MINKYFIGILLVAIITSIFFLPIKSEKVNLIENDKFSELIEEDVFILQVHTPYYGEIEGTDLVLEDWENIEDYLDELPPKERPIAVYCRSGRMSGIVSKQLIDLGYEVVYDLDGGMNSWEQSGRELVII